MNDVDFLNAVRENSAARRLTILHVWDDQNNGTFRQQWFRRTEGYFRENL